VIGFKVGHRTLRGDVGAAALSRQVVLQLFYLLPILLQLHLKLFHQATEITKQGTKNKTKHILILASSIVQ